MELTEEDYLAYFLYFASINPAVKRNRWTRLLLSMAIFGSLAFYFVMEGKTGLGYYFGGAGLVYAAIYPWYSRWLFRRHYLKNVRANFKPDSQGVQQLDIKTDRIHIAVNGMETAIEAKSIDSIHETGQHVFIKTRQGIGVIINKEKTKQPGEILQSVRDLSTRQDIPMTFNPTWKWR